MSFRSSPTSVTTQTAACNFLKSTRFIKFFHFRSFAEIKNDLRSRNSSILSFQPRTFSYLPHLSQHEDSLRPQVHLGRGRFGVTLVLGIPTVQRQKDSYLVNTVGSLLFDLSSQDKADMVIIIFVAESNMSFVKSVVQTLQKNFPDDVKSGLLEVIAPSPHFYPDFTQLKSTFGDTQDRVKWRTKQNLDYSFLMLYAQPKAIFYVQLEDDIVARPGYSKVMKSFATSVLSNEWLFLEFSQLGFIGKMFRTTDLPMIVDFFLMFHKDKPIDWLLDHILWVKVCNPEESAKQCAEQKDKLKQRYKPSQFQHVGLHSSLPGKIQKLRDKDFEKHPFFIPHGNPEANVNTSLNPYQGHTLDKAYRGQDFFWAFSPTVGDFIQIDFLTPQPVKEYLFRSGNFEASSDKFHNTTVEVLPSDHSVSENLGRTGPAQYHLSSDGFVVIGSFVNGIAEGQIDSVFQKLSAIRLVVHSDSDMWVLLSEISIKV
ncbi:alpha-1,3-mannosyl-glycoprotein 4-beta-N-acetylglucosaminyltransferase B isoform X2 [Denticeps clupeoides]|uniref:alpha-1,3-mannosyl-glycoprotein 4-beta-N-acetylglucosaminyltransferase B isoform X2 n=1 Tax=Denticeps clupeoides TaxID=299321 RepID=UPI0010A2D048|nr:alpha-1,3-mannosyl-glycoprotein 4-beta-N-acetylglucosaminyltransferase B-like isoform X2 [Denticeps clupeoides]